MTQEKPKNRHAGGRPQRYFPARLSKYCKAVTEYERTVLDKTLEELRANGSSREISKMTAEEQIVCYSEILRDYIQAVREDADIQQVQNKLNKLTGAEDMVLRLEFEGTGENFVKWSYNKGDWRSNTCIQADPDGERIHVSCMNVKKFETWGTGENASTADIYFSNGAEITFTGANNIKCI